MDEQKNAPVQNMVTHQSSHVKDAYSKDALEFMHNLGKQSNDFTAVEINGHTYVNTGDLVRIKPVEKEEAPTYRVFTLQGLIDYINDDPDDLLSQFPRLIVHVADPRTVHLYTKTYGTDNSVRTMLATCVCTNKPYIFDVQYDREEFMVKLMSLFVQDENAKKVGSVVGNLTVEDATTIADDGMSQNVIVKSGIARKSSVKIENPVKLSPIRTFPDIKQPQSMFVLRIKNAADHAEPKVALYDADGDQWKTKAVRSIHDYLAKGLEQLINDGKLSIIA
ncbi:MAG: hypothetical protein IKK34_08300 [Clostridia bacterium]|nr:hypothetical protein [Clostridia bacterium]